MLGEVLLYNTYFYLLLISKRSQWNNEHTILKRSTIHLLCNVCIFYNLHKRNGDYKIGEKLLNSNKCVLGNYNSPELNMIIFNMFIKR